MPEVIPPLPRLDDAIHRISNHHSREDFRWCVRPSTSGNGSLRIHQVTTRDLEPDGVTIRVGFMGARFTTWPTLSEALLRYAETIPT